VYVASTSCLSTKDVDEHEGRGVRRIRVELRRDGRTQSRGKNQPARAVDSASLFPHCYLQGRKHVFVMPGLGPGIHVLLSLCAKDVDGRDKPGHDCERV